MKNNIKILVSVIVTAIICISVTVYATGGLTARNVGYSNDTAKTALDDLYKKYDLNSIEEKKVCQYQSEGSFGAKGTVGAKYKCQLGAEDSDNNGVIYRYFYILAVNNDNTVDLIMDRNISSGTMTWINAMKYFTDDSEGIAYKNKWTNILGVDLPKAQAIVDAVNYSEWKIVEHSNLSSEQWFYFETKNQNLGSTTNYVWLWDYLYGCGNYNCEHDPGSSYAQCYVTRDLDKYSNDLRAWTIFGQGGYIASGYIVSQNIFGIRPVITLLQSNLYD